MRDRYQNVWRESPPGPISFCSESPLQSSLYWINIWRIAALSIFCEILLSFNLINSNLELILGLSVLIIDIDWWHKFRFSLRLGFFPRKYLLYAPPLILEYNIIELVAPAFAFFNSSSSHFDSIISWVCKIGTIEREIVDVNRVREHTLLPSVRQLLLVGKAPFCTFSLPWFMSYQWFAIRSRCTLL